MDTTRIAQPVPKETREVRGISLYRDHADEIIFEAKLGVWLVPNQYGATSVYEVTLGRRGESCECRDFEFRGGPCLHIVAATIARAKSTTCDCCGHRVPWKFVTEVTEDDGLLAWFPGDRLCDACAPGHWA